MMNWGKKKPSSSLPSSSSSSHNHLISRVFPVSWLSKFKRKSEKTNSNSNSNVKENPPRNLQMKSPKNPIPAHYWDNKLYTQDNDGFWRLASSKENTSSYCENCKSNVKKEVGTKKTYQKKVSNSEILPENGKLGSKEGTKNESLQKTYKRIMEATKELNLELDKVNGYRKSMEKELSDFELEKVMEMMEVSSSRKNPDVISRNQGEIHQNTRDGNYMISEWEKLKDAKIKEVLVKNEKQRKSFHVKRGSNKIRVSSPKTPLKIEPCKVKALEDMKKAKIKKKMKSMQVTDKASNLGSFAVVKTSQDPQQDFRDSMLEMIIEKRITRPEELEELLACYLTLNANEYHDLIIKVFAQVWNELEEIEQVNQK